MRRHLSARGWSCQTVALLVVSVCLAGALAQVSVALRPAPSFVADPGVLERLVLVSLVLPLAIVLRQMEDRGSWLFATGARTPVPVRATYFTFQILVAAAVGTTLAAVLRMPEFFVLILADTILLFSLGAVTAVLLGASYAWTVPAVVAVACTTPGLVPIDHNHLVQRSQDGVVLGVAVATCAVAMLAFAFLDDYGLSRSRLLGRQPGVTEE